ncbi:MAG: chemotaxis protein CheB [Acidobacteriales bacterium]|nr:chemotaxis protein CheB [Terriglobales bacterium]
MGSAKIPVLSKEQQSSEKTHFQVVAIGTSAGGLFALSEVLKRLPSALSSSVVVVQHLSPTHKSSLVPLLARITQMQVKEAVDKAVLEPGTVYVAPPDAHVVFSKKRLRLNHSVALNFHRPSIDTTFESIANSFGNKVIAVVLTGSGSDGSIGIAAVKRAGGTTIAQDPSEAEFPSMPKSAIATGCVDKVLRLAEIGPVIESLCS